MKKDIGLYIANFIVWLLILMFLSITDFSIPGMPWDDEIQAQMNYPSIAYDCTKIPEKYIGQTDYPK